MDATYRQERVCRTLQNQQYMDLLRGFTKRAPSSPGSAAAATGGSPPTEECTPGDRLFQLSQVRGVVRGRVARCT